MGFSTNGKVLEKFFLPHKLVILVTRTLSPLLPSYSLPPSPFYYPLSMTRVEGGEVNSPDSPVVSHSYSASPSTWMSERMFLSIPVPQHTCSSAYLSLSIRVVLHEANQQVNHTLSNCISSFAMIFTIE